MSRRALLLAAAALALAWLAILGRGLIADERITDLYIYAAYADQFLDGELPYRDVAFEYPPLAAVVIALPGIVGTDYETYRVAFAALTFLLALVVVLGSGALARVTGGDYRLALGAAALAPLLAGAMIRTHFDLAPVALTVLALVALVRDRTVLGFVLLGLGGATKAFPLAVAPIALAWLLARGERRTALEAGGALVATLAACVALALVLSPSGFEQMLRYQTDRPVQIESSPATVLRVIDALGGAQVRAVHSHKSDALAHPADELVSALFLVAALAVIALLTVGAVRQARSGEAESRRALVLAASAAIVATAAFATVLSPQFLVWSIPLLALACGSRMWPLAAVTAAAIGLTLVEFPLRYEDLVAHDPFAIRLVAARDALLIAAVLLALWALLRRRSRAAARSIAPALPGPPR